MTDTWTWATVTQASPLRIKVDGDTSALDATTGDLVGSLAVSDRVRVHLHSDGIIVTGIQGGQTGFWTAYTPTLGASGTVPSLGNGTLVGKYTQIGLTVFYKLQLTLGSTTTLGSGYLQLGVPSNITDLLISVNSVLNPGGTARAGGGQAVSPSTVRAMINDVLVGATAPTTFETGNFIRITGMYETVA